MTYKILFKDNSVEIVENCALAIILSGIYVCLNVNGELIQYTDVVSIEPVNY